MNNTKYIKIKKVLPFQKKIVSLQNNNIRVQLLSLLDMKHLSGIITTLNEEQNIVAAIQSLQQVCDEVVVVDSLSSDRTAALAEEAGAKVVLQPYLGDGLQKNIALQHVNNDWVLSIDADERLTPELVAFIERTDLDSTPYDGFAVRRRNMIGSRWVKACGWYPDYLVRLYRHSKLCFREVKQHSSVPEANTLRVKADLLHYRYRNIGELFAKPGRDYSTRGAKILYSQGRRVHCWTPSLHGTGAFLSNYLLRGGIVGGIDGLTLSLAVATNSYLKYAKVLEWQRDPQVLSQTDFNSVW